METVGVADSVRAWKIVGVRDGEEEGEGRCAWMEVLGTEKNEMGMRGCDCRSSKKGLERNRGEIQREDG